MKYLAVPLLLISLATQSQESEAEVLDKYVEIQQHSFLAAHLDDKCKFLSSSDRLLLDQAIKALGDEITLHPLNKVKSLGNPFLSATMKERAELYHCDEGVETYVQSKIDVAKIILKHYQ
ncbi:hypothetical protein [Pseudoalteromonas rubra]|uniref:Uncharacterized protein n=2 Tax=Pseudoalteromonas TaxID=53246 RepID=A0A5S3WZI3_9GAMM|nr:hypothetical protein [Pseudoalteromonas rubra]TMP37306.1 hypothetical protein CWB98_11285 [Pseudoalteromonas rubra]